MAGPQTLWCEQGGHGGRLLLLLHGLGANAAVWDGMKSLLAERWPGRWVAVDFRGHGRSFHGAPYGLGIHAADVAAVFGQDEAVTVIGHSMGGAVAILLASGLFGLDVRRVIAFSVKVDWTAEDASRAQAVAQAPVKTFATRQQAIERYLRVSGLTGLVDPESPAAAVGICETQGGFRLAADPLTNALGAPDLVMAARAAKAPLRLLCGENDGVASSGGMRQLGDGLTILPGLGHNLHVEAPAALWRAIERDLCDDPDIALRQGAPANLAG